MLLLLKFIRILLAFMYIVDTCLCKTFAICELAIELRKQGFPYYQLNDWLCLIEAESTRRTDAIGGPDDDGSYDYGLFQINDRYWCSHGPKPGKECHVQCKDLITSNITKASACAKKIYAVHGFEAWLGWVNECKGRKQLWPNIRYCS